MVETSLILALVSVVAVGSLGTVGDSMLQTLQSVADAVAAAL